MTEIDSGYEAACQAYAKHSRRMRAGECDRIAMVEAIKAANRFYLRKEMNDLAMKLNFVSSSPKGGSPT